MLVEVSQCQGCPHLGSSADVACTDCAVVIRERHDISPEPVLNEKRLEEIAITSGGGEFKLGEPVLSDRVHLMIDAFFGLEPKFVAREG